MMTLKEYINQPDPERHPKVLLIEADVERSHKVRISFNRWIQEIRIPSIWNKFGRSGDYGYYLKISDRDCLYVPDKYGNPGAYSVFYLPD